MNVLESYQGHSKDINNYKGPEHEEGALSPGEWQNLEYVGMGGRGRIFKVRIMPGQRESTGQGCNE